MSYKFEGTVKVINDTMTFDSGFRKREIVLTSDDKYPQDVKFEFLKDDADMLDTFKVGDVAIISFSLGGNEYNGKYYVNVKGYSITKKAVSKSVTPPAPEVEEFPVNDSEDDLPF